MELWQGGAGFLVVGEGSRVGCCDFAHLCAVCQIRDSCIDKLKYEGLCYPLLWVNLIIPAILAFIVEKDEGLITNDLYLCC